MNSQLPKSPKLLSSYAESSRYMGLGIHFALTTLLSAAGGWWLDRYFSTLPVFLLGGLFFGAGAGFYHLYVKLVDMEKRDKASGK